MYIIFMEERKMEEIPDIDDMIFSEPYEGPSER